MNISKQKKCALYFYTSYNVYWQLHCFWGVSLYLTFIMYFLFGIIHSRQKCSEESFCRLNVCLCFHEPCGLLNVKISFWYTEISLFQNSQLPIVKPRKFYKSLTWWNVLMCHLVQPKALIFFIFLLWNQKLWQALHKACWYI